MKASRMTTRTATATIMATDAVTSPGLERMFTSFRGRIVSVGDRLIVAFDAASDAVDAALAMQTSAPGDEAGTLCRVGMAAGDVAWEGSACTGAAVVTAVALLDAAGVGQVLVDEAVPLLAGDPSGDRYARAGSLTVAGTERRTDMFRMRPTRSAARQADVPPMPLALGGRVAHRFVGRVTTMDELSAAWDDAHDGAGRLLLVSGEAGAGKTRLATEFGRTLHESGAGVLYGGCEEDLALPYQPWVEVTNQFLDASSIHAIGADFASRLGPLAPLVARIDRLISQVPRVTPDPGTERFRTYDAFASVLTEAAARWPTLVVLDDLHWAGPQTLALLRHVARSGLPRRLLILGTFRDTGVDMTEPLASCLADLRRVDGVDRRRLPGLDRVAVEHFVGAALKQDELAPAVRAFAHQLAERSGGNAFFVGELWRHLVDTGAIAVGGDGWVVNDEPTAAAVPDGVREVVTARLTGLSVTARRIAALAAVAGQRVDHSVLASAAGVDVVELARAIDELAARGLVARIDTRASTFQFEHAIVSDTVGAGIPTHERGALHLALAEAIEVVYEADRRSVLAELARHFAAATPNGSPDKAVYYGRRAARQALRSAAYEEAVAHLEAIIQVAPRDVSRAEALVELGTARLRLGLFDASRDACEHGFELAAELGASAIAARAAVGFEESLHFPGLPGGPAVALLRRALELVGDERTPNRALVTASLGRALMLAGQRAESISAAEAAVALARSIDDLESLAVGLQTLGLIVDDPNDALRVAEELTELAERQNDPWNVAYGLAIQLRNLVVLGQIDRAAIALDRHCAVSSMGRFSTFQFMSASLEAVLALPAGDFACAEAAAQRAADAGIDAPFDAGVYGLQMFAIRRAQGRLTEVAPVVRALTRSADPLPMWRPGLAALYVEMGMLNEAREVFDDLAPDGFASVARDTVWPACLTFLADTCIAIADRDQAAVLYDELLRFAGRNLMAGLTICFGPADRLLGGLAELLGRPDDADRHFRIALQLAETSRSPVWRAEAQFDWAVVLAGRGDPSRAQLLGRSAIATANELGMGRLSSRTVPGEPPVIAAQPAMSVRVVLPAGLSEREAEVLRLVAGGLSNRQIGDHLYISQNTVANHVRAILQKTSSANRAEAASFAVRRGVVDA